MRSERYALGFIPTYVINRMMDDLKLEQKKVTPHLDYQFPESMEQTDDALAEQVRQTVDVLNSLVLTLHQREISIKLSPVMNHYEKTSHYVVEIHKHL